MCCGLLGDFLMWDVFFQSHKSSAGKGKGHLSFDVMLCFCSLGFLNLLLNVVASRR